jgi:hypothetical protein
VKKEISNDIRFKKLNKVFDNYLNRHYFDEYPSLKKPVSTTTSEQQPLFNNDQRNPQFSTIDYNL